MTDEPPTVGELILTHLRSLGVRAGIDQVLDVLWWASLLPSDVRR